MKKFIPARANPVIPKKADEVSALRAELSASPSYRALEQRIAFDAAAIATADSVLDHAAESAPDASPDSAHAAIDVPLAAGDIRGLAEAVAGAAAFPAAVDEAIGVAIVFIDSRVQDAGVIANAIPDGAEIVLVDASSDGLAQIAAALEGRTDVGSIHIVSHGRPGELILGSGIVDAATLAGDQSGSVAAIRDALADDADVLLYGCDVAEGASGAAFVTALAEATGADVAASTDDTGSAEAGGDWELEHTYGSVAAASIGPADHVDLLSATNTGAWSIAGSTASTTISGITTTVTFTASSANSAFTSISNAAFNTIPVFSNGADGDPSLSFVFAWDTTPEPIVTLPQPQASTDSGIGTITITFSQPVTNPIINLDRLGGNSAYDPNTSVTGDEQNFSNGAMWTVTTPGATLTEVSGTSHFDVTSTTIVRTPNQAMPFSGTSSESGTNPLTNTAAGSVRVNGTFTTITFQLSGVGVEGGGQDGIEIGFILDPLPNANNDTFNVNEDATLAGNLFANNGSGTDADPQGDAITVTHINGVAVTVGAPVTLANGTLTLTNASTGAFTFVPNAEYSGTQAFNYTIADPAGGSDTATATINIVAVNDPPDAVNDSYTVAEDSGATTFAVLGNDSFAPDTGETLTITGVTQPAGGTVTFTATGVTFTPNANFNGTTSFTYTISDGNGGSDTATVTVNVTPVNDPPSGSDATRSILEGTSYAFGISDFAFSDVDGDTLQAVTITTLPANGTLALGGAPVTVGQVIPAASLNSLTWTPAPNASGTPLASFTFQVGDGTTFDPTPNTFTFNVTPVNDAPVSTALGDLANNDADVVSVDVSGNFSDPDATDALTFSATGLPAGLSIDPSTGVISGTIQHSASVSGPYSVTITATDPSGATTQQTFTWSVDNPAPDAQDDDLAGSENATLTGSVLADNGNGTDSDADGDTLVVSAVNGVAGNVGNAIAGSNGGTFTVQASGAYTFVPGADFDDLAVGETRTTTITYTIQDNEGGSDTATVTVTITGTNDAPVSTALGDLANNDADVVSVDVSGNFSDPDASDVLTFSATGLPAGLSIDPSTGIISGTIQHSASVTGPYSVTITATDPSGATTQQTFTWSVDNPAPDAQDDDLAGTENATLTGSVLANNGNGIDSDADGDTLVVSAVNGVAGNVGNAVAGSNGGTFTVDASGAYTFVPGADFDDLAVGETRTTTITYTIQDNEGGSDTATVTVTITGTNDAPVSTALGDLANSDADVVSVDVSGSFSDPDTSDVLTFSATGLPAGLSIDPSSGMISGTIDNSASVTGPYSVTITATDPSGATTQQTFTWSVDNPAPDAQDDDLAGSENATLTGSVLANNGNGVDSDADGDTLVVSAVNGVVGNVGNAIAGSNGGTFTVDASGAYTFVPGSDFDDLAVGETRTTTITYTITDNEGGSDTATVTVTITGTNDAPVSTALGDLSNSDADVVSVDVSGNFSDPDATDALTFSATGLPAGLSIDPSTGIISGTIQHSASVTGPYSVTITATDPSGATTQQTFTWSVDNPAPDAQDDDLAGSENATLTGSVLADNGNGVDSDADGDTLVVSAVNGVAGNVGSAVTGSNGGTFTVDASGAYTFVPGADFDDLAVGETRTTTITYTIQDNEGGSDTATVTVTITGTNDAPVSTALGDLVNNDADVVSVDVSGNFSDPDASDVLTFSATGLPAGLSIDPSSGVISGTIDNSASVTGPYSVTITATDPSGATTQQTFTWSVDNPAPDAQDDDLAGSENATLTGSVLADNGNGTDSDVDGDTLVVSAVNGVVGNVGSAVTGSNGGTFTMDASGAYTFVPGADFDDLAVGETRTTTITYTITDNEGGSDTATVTVTITGTNDSPVSTALGDLANNDADVVSVDVSGNFSDPDATDVLTFSATGLPAGLSIDPSTGIISGTIQHSASVTGPYSVTITATDPSGATTQQTFTWSVDNPAPDAQDDDLAGSENATLTGSVLGDNGNGTDSDVDGDTLVVSAVNGVAGNVGSAIAGSNGGTFTVQSSGAYTFVPGSDFDDLAVGETRTTTITYTITDNEGGSDTATVTVTITGTNDAPVSTALGDLANNDADVVSVDVSGSFSDPDASDVLTFSATGLPAGLAIDPSTGIISGTIQHSASVTGPYSVTITATDPSGATTQQTFTWSVDNPAPDAQDDDLAGSENATLTGSVLANNGNGVDSDADDDTLVVSAVNGVVGNVGNAIAGSNGGTFTVDASGAYTFVPGSDFDDLAVGETRTTTITYTITDNEGGSDTATVTVTITGTNDAPVSTALGDLANSDADVVSIDVSGNFSDPDASDALTFSATGLPAGLSIDPSSGMISGTIDNSASVTGPYSVTITATDPSGATTQQTFTWSVDNPAPDAQDDDLAGSENATLTGSVLADNGNGIDSDADGDTLVVSAVNGVAGNVGSAVAGSNGGTFTVQASGAYTFVPGADFDDLAVGETRTTTITYTIQDNEGGSDTATVTVTITGTNDAPVSTALGDLANNDADVVSVDVSGNFSDPDATDVLTFSATGLPAGLSIDPSTGVISGTIDNSASVSGPYSVTITATDPSGATTQQTFTWSVDNPAPDAQDDDLAGTENATLTGSVLANNGNGADSDVDGDTLVVSAVNGVAGNVGSAVAGSNGGTFTVQASGAYTFVPGGDFDDLAVGETRTTTITYTITDNEGGSDTATVTVTITGTNDAPVSTALGDLSNNDADVVSVDVSGSFSDPDASDVLTFSATGLPAGLSIDPSTGVISGTIQHSASVTGPYSVTITATDPSGATTQQTFTWSVDNPAPDAQDDDLAGTENATLTGSVLADNGNGTDSDVDGDTLVVSAVNGVVGNVGSAVAGSNGGTFTIQASGAYTFVPGADFDDLAVGETRTTTITYTIQDNEGGSDTATVTVTITGTNDAPVSTALGDLANNDADVVSVDVSGNFSDPDATDVLTFSATGLPAGLSIDPSTGVISGTIDNSASVSGPYSVTITATDPSGATTQQTFTWSVDNPAPDAQDDDLAGTENATLTGSVLANNGNGADSDVDGDTLVVSAVNGVAGNVGSAVAGSNGGTFTVQASGAYTFVPGGDFDDLAVGETRTTTITYTITDNEGGSDTATVTVTITGTNDAPVSTALGDLSNNDADVVSVDVSGSFSDPDASDVLTFSATGLPAGLSIDPSTGVISGTIQHSASVTGPYSVTITATDPSGATTQQTFTWSVDNPAPDAQDDDLAGTENATLTGSVLADNGNGTDSDVDGDTLVVSAVNGVVGNVGSAVAGSNGGTFTVQASGAYTFVPGADFDDLAVGETRTTTITYTIQDNEGGSDTATVTVTITGTNDAPVSTALGDLANSDADVVSIDVSGNFSDPDASDALTFSATGLPAGLSIDPSSGMISGTIDNSASVTGPYSVTITATDPSGATTQQTFTWSVDNPAPDAQDDDLAGSENATLTGSVLANNGNGVDSDVDGDTLVVSAVNGVAGNVGNAIAGSNGGTFTVDASGAYTFVPGADFDDLAVGETRTTTITYTIQDNEGGSDTATVTVTITGTNDAPVSTPLSNLSNDDADVVSVDVSGNFSDPDASDVLTFSATGLPAGLAIDPSTGVISGTIDNSASVTGPYSVTITATDPSGATTQQTFTWSVDNPAPDAQDDDLAGTENATLTGSVLANNGNGVDSDVDGDTLVVSAVNGVAGNVGSAVAGSNGGTFTVQSSGAYTFVPGADFDDLAVGETRTTTITYTIQDNEGGSDTATVTVTITGTNDAPVSTPLSNLSNDDADVVSVDVSGNFSDPDASDVLTFSATGLPAGLAIDPSSGIISGTIQHSASVTGPYSVTITATDPSGATTQQTFTWSVDNPAPDAQDDDLAGSENATLTGSVLANNGNGADSDADGDTLVVSAVNGVAGNVGSAVAGSNGGTFTVQASGAYTFVPGADFDDLAVGETRTTTITYTIQDNEGGSDTATVTVTITGTNDAPVSTPLSNLSNDDADVVSVDVSGNFSDPDASDVLTFSATGLPAGLAIDPSTGVISGTIDNSASVTGPYSVTITATDPSGATTQQTFTWSVDNPAPDAQDDDLAGTENATLTGSVLANNGNGVDSDVDGDTLVVSAVNGVAGNVGSAVAGSNGGTFTVQSSGAYTFVPGADFDDLAVGETRTTTITYTIQDNEGGSDTATVTVTITGTNDAPVSTPLSNLSNDDADVVSVDVSGNFSDSDASDALTFSATGLPAGLAIDPSTGIISGTIDNSASVTGPYSVTITATDPSGATTQQTFTWSVDNPAPDAQDDDLAGSENATLTGSVLANNGNGIDSDVDGDTLVVSAVNGVAGNVGNAVAGSNGGTFTVDASGAYTFVPGADFDDLAVGETRTTTITYTVQDNEGGSDTATVTVTITGTNDAPVSTALGDLANNDADVVSVDVSGNFSDPDATDVLTFSATGLPAGLTIDPSTGIISGTIQHSASVSGPYSVTITATDPSGATTQQTFTWSVDNPAPDAQDDDLAGSENATLTGSVLANNGNGADSDADGDTLVVSAVNGVVGNVGNAVAGSNGGTFTVQSSGAYTFVPGSDFDDLAVGETRTTTITYTIQDNEGGSDTATVTVTITGTNDAPVSTALGDLANNDADVVSVDVSGNFSDPDASDVLTFSATGLPAGLAIDPSTGVISGTIDNSASVTGPYSVTITATDPSGATTQQTFTWSVDNPAPDAQDDDLAGSENATLTGSVLADNGNGIDSDVDGDTLVVSAVNGVAGNVGSAVTGSNGGTFTVDASGAYTFVPGSDFDDLAVGETRTTTITYTIQDNEGGSDTATVTVTITGTNDAPVSTALGDLANSDADVVSVDVSGSFSDPDASDVLTFSATGLPAGLSIDPSTGVISGTIDNSASVSGPYSVTITATDPSGATTQQTFTWSVDNPAPDAQDDDLAGSENATLTGSVLANNGNGIDSDADGDTLVVSAVNGVAGNVGSAVAGSNGGTFTVQSSGAYTFVPGSDFDDLAVGETRTTTITYTIQDNEGGSDTATVTVTITGTNDAPVASSPPLATPEDTPVDGTITSSDIDGDTLTYTLANPPANGSVTLNPDGTFTYTPDPDYNGGDTFTVTVSDGNGGSVDVTIPVTITGTNDAPVASSPPLSTPEDTPVDGTITSSDIDGDTLTYTLANPPANGSVTLNPDGTFTYTPDPDYNGGDTFTVTVSDGNGGSVDVTIPVTVTPVNDAPLTSSPPLATPEDTPVDGTITSSDIDGDTLTYTLANPPANGTVTLNPDGTFTYTPDPDYNGGDTFTVTVSDGNGGSVDVTIPVTVTPVNDAPVASDDTATSSEDRPVTIAVLANDSDPDGDPLQVIAATTGDGSVVVNPDGTITFTPAAGFDGIATVTYVIGDGHGGTATATVRIDCSPAVVIGPDAAANEPTPIGWSSEPVSVDGIVLDVVERIWNPRHSSEFGTDSEVGRNAPYDVRGISSFSVKLTSSQTGSVAKIETFVRDRVLVVSLMLDDQTSDDRVEWKVQRADGRPLPDWLDFVGGDVLMGERAADEEQIDLRVTAVLPDGTLIVNEVRIQTSTGEVQPIKLGKAGSIAPSLYWDRLDAGSLLKEAEVRGLAQRLARVG